MELGTIITAVKVIPGIFSKLKEWWILIIPAGKVLQDYLDNKKVLKVYLKDLLVPNNTFSSPKLFSQEGDLLQINPNISKVWPEVEGRTIARLFNLLGSLGKKQKIEIVEMSKGYGEWDSNMIILGAQAVKCREFYQVMEDVAYGVDDDNIYNFKTGKPIELTNKNYGYGIILKAKNPHNKNGSAFLLGGFGTLGTEAAIYFFINNIALLGKEFGNKNFGIVVRARIASGEQSTERIGKYDKVF